jgi:hypothetical protein
MSVIELDCLERLAEAMKQHLDEFNTIPPPGHPIWRVFWAWSYINRIIYHHREHPTVSSGHYGNVFGMLDIFVLVGILICGNYGRDGLLMESAGIATHHCDHTATGAQHFTGGFAVGCGELINDG